MGNFQIKLKTKWELVAVVIKNLLKFNIKVS